MGQSLPRGRTVGVPHLQDGCQMTSIRCLLVRLGEDPRT
ncbi:unnamed protein product [Gulo gulo]|uniref:Uncharacterized protein n=1 Tax=Gulo gulo TaxID=48420 RepID=A0A9X9MA67_GULGU|nr:unnamed protein product [Gulo gulo]